MSPTWEVHADGWCVRLDLSRQILRLEVPEAVVDRSHRGKPQAPLARARAALTTHTACQLGGLPVAVLEVLADAVSTATARFLGDQFLSRPLGFYTWTPELAGPGPRDPRPAGRRRTRRSIWIHPGLTVEPLPSLYGRRAAGYRFVRSVLEDAFGADALHRMHRLTPEGAATDGLAEELAWSNCLMGRQRRPAVNWECRIAMRTRRPAASRRGGKPWRPTRT